MSASLGKAPLGASELASVRSAAPSSAGESSSRSAHAGVTKMSFIAIGASLQAAVRPTPAVIAQTNTESGGPAHHHRSTDRFGLRHSSAEADAVTSFEAAVQGVAAHKPSIGKG